MVTGEHGLDMVRGCISPQGASVSVGVLLSVTLPVAYPQFVRSTGSSRTASSGDKQSFSHREPADRRSDSVTLRVRSRSFGSSFLVHPLRGSSGSSVRLERLVLVRDRSRRIPGSTSR